MLMSELLKTVSTYLRIFTRNNTNLIVIGKIVIANLHNDGGSSIANPIQDLLCQLYALGANHSLFLLSEKSEI